MAGEKLATRATQKSNKAKQKQKQLQSDKKKEIEREGDGERGKKIKRNYKIKVI